MKWDDDEVDVARPNTMWRDIKGWWKEHWEITEHFEFIGTGLVCLGIVFGGFWMYHAVPALFAACVILVIAWFIGMMFHA